MSEEKCVICAILENDERNQIIFQGPNLTAIRKDYKSKTTNFMLVTNQHIGAFRDLDLATPEGVVIWREVMVAAKHLARGRDFGLKITNGEKSGQTVHHAHVHVFSHESAWSNVK